MTEAIPAGTATSNFTNVITSPFVMLVTRPVLCSGLNRFPVPSSMMRLKGRHSGWSGRSCCSAVTIASVSDWIA